MRVLWSVFITFPEVADFVGHKPEYACTWVRAMAERLRLRDDVNLAVVTVGNCKQIQKYEKNNITFFFLPGGSQIKKTGGGVKTRQDWSFIIDEFKPDFIHVFGTEYAHSIELFNLKLNLPILISLQGILTGYYKHSFGGMEFKEIFLSLTPRDIVKCSGVILDKLKMKKEALKEQAMLKKAEYVTGRTLWDKVHSLHINPNLKYYFCLELMRKEFYESTKWDIKNITRHTIFIHQGTKPIKGLHYLLQAVYILKKDFPNIKIVMSGNNYLDNSTVYKKVKISGYANYLNKLIRKLKLENNISFTGILNASQIIKQLKNAHVVALPSSIENSPNSLVEAILIGTPCVASFVGGVPEMLIDKKEGYLYCYNEPLMLAEYIRQIFNSDEIASNMSNNLINSEYVDRNPNNIVEALLNMYIEIINDFSKRDYNIGGNI